MLLALVVVASAAGSAARSNGDILLLRGQHLWVVTPAGSDVRELTPPGFEVEAAAWSPEEDAAWTRDSKTLLFTRSRGVHLMGVYSVSRTGRGLRRLVPGGSEPTLSPDGRRLAFIRDQHLWIAPRSGAGARPVTAGEIAEAGPDWGSR